MAALLVAMSIMAVMMTVAMPVWKQTAQREKEEELVFRGMQYVHAIGAVPAQDRQRVPAEHRRAGRAAVPAQEVQGPDHERRFRAVARGGRRRRRSAGPRQPAGRRAADRTPCRAGLAVRLRRSAQRVDTSQGAGGASNGDAVRHARRGHASEASAASPARARINRFASTTAAATTTSGRSSTSSRSRRPACGRRPGERGPGGSAAPRLPARAASAAEAVHPIAVDRRARGRQNGPGPGGLGPSRADSAAERRRSSRCHRHASRPLLS